jgi:hypothetical protein
LLKFMEGDTQGDPLGDFLRAQETGRRPRPHIRLPMAPIEQQKPLGSPNTSIRLALHDSLYIEQDPGEPMAKFFAAGNWWYIHPEFISAFQRLSGRQSVPFRDLAVLVPDKQLIGMLAAALDTLAAAGLVLKEETEN